MAQTLTYRETWQRMGISESTFRRLKATGLFDRLLAPIPHRFSKAKVDAFIEGQRVSSRPWKAA